MSSSGDTRERVHVLLEGWSRPLEGWVVTWDDPEVPDRPVKVKLDDGRNTAVVWAERDQVTQPTLIDRLRDHLQAMTPEHRDEWLLDKREDAES